MTYKKGQTVDIRKYTSDNVIKTGVITDIKSLGGFLNVQLIVVGGCGYPDSLYDIEIVKE